MERSLGEDRKKTEERIGKNPGEDREGPEEELVEDRKNSWKEPLAGKNQREEQGRTLREDRT